MTIWANTLVQNEDKYLWYAVMSVIDHIDKVLIWDTGSQDKTVDIVKLIQKSRPGKVIFKEIGKVSPQDYPQARDEMLKLTKSDWFMILDGDEVWWDESIRKIVSLANTHNSKLDSIVSKYTNVIGDIYHFQEEAAGKYQIDDVKGHLTIRAMNRHIKGIHVAKPHGQNGIFAEDGTAIQDLNSKRRIHLNELSFMHFTHMKRSSSQKAEDAVPKRTMKFKHELGNEVSKDYYFPEVFFLPKPEIVDFPFKTMDKRYYYQALFTTLPRKIKRRIWEGRSGY